MCQSVGSCRVLWMLLLNNSSGLRRFSENNSSILSRAKKISVTDAQLCSCVLDHTRRTLRALPHRFGSLRVSPVMLITGLIWALTRQLIYALSRGVTD